MAEMLAPTISETGTPPSNAVEQARIRKERREAKIKAKGTDRLNKITGLGGINRELQQHSAASNSASDHAADPEEVDISQQLYQPISTTRLRSPQQQADSILTDDQIRSMMLGLPHNQSGSGPPPSSPPGSSGSFSGFPGMDDIGSPGGEDSILKLLQQMMGGLPSELPNGMSSFPGMPPIGMPRQETIDTALGNSSTQLWRIVHAVFALTLGLFIAYTAGFTGTNMERQRSSLKSAFDRQNNAHFFYIFATAEVLLQTGRFLFEKEAIQPSGVLGTIIGFLPQPWKGYLALVLRYGRIWTTVSGDALVCVFVLGVCSWIRAA